MEIKYKNLTIKKSAITLTAYRALFIAQLLFKGEKSTDEILQAFSHDNFLSEACHKDTISNSINSLREAGFEIEKPKPSNKYKYKLISHPLIFKTEKSTIEYLNLIRNSLYYQNNYELIFKLNSVYDSLKTFCDINNYDALIEQTNCLRKINKNILDELIELCKTKGAAIITYNSPINSTEEIKVQAHKVVFENNRLYLWIYSYKHNSPAYLRIDKISNVQLIENSEEFNMPVFYSITYELKNETAKKFMPQDNEIIIQKLTDKIIVKAEVINTFNFFQRIIAFAQDCKILTPVFVIEKYKKHLDEILEVYENE